MTKWWLFQEGMVALKFYKCNLLRYQNKKEKLYNHLDREILFGKM